MPKMKKNEVTKPEFPSVFSLLKWGGKVRQNDLKRALINLEIAYSTIWDVVFQSELGAKNAVWIAEGDIIDALGLVRKYLEKSQTQKAKKK